MYFGAMNSILGADLPWISELFCAKRRGKCIAYSTPICCSYEQQYAYTSVFPYTGVWHRFAVDFEAILRETAREVYSILDQAAPVWSPNGGRRFHAKEPERRGKAVGD